MYFYSKIRKGKYLFNKKADCKCFEYKINIRRINSFRMNVEYILNNILSWVKLYIFLL